MDAPIDVLKIEHNVVSKELARFRPCDPETRCYFCREWAQFIYRKHLTSTGKAQHDNATTKTSGGPDCVLHAGRFAIKLPKFSDAPQQQQQQQQQKQKQHAKQQQQPAAAAPQPKERSTKLFDAFKKQLDSSKNGGSAAGAELGGGSGGGDLTEQVISMCEHWIEQPSNLVVLPTMFEPVEFDPFDESLLTAGEPKEPARLLDPLVVERQHIILPSNGFHLLKNLTGDILLSHKEPACEHMRPEWKSPGDLDVDRDIFNEKMAREVKTVLGEIEQALHESWRHLTGFIEQVKLLDKERNALMGKDCQRNIDYFAQKQALPSFQDYWASQGDFKKKRADIATVDAAFVGYFDQLASKVKDFQTSCANVRLDAVCTLIQKLWDLVVPTIQQMAERMASFEVKNDAYMESCNALSKSLDTLHPIDDVRSAVETVRLEIDTRIAEYMQEIEALKKTYKDESRPNVAGRLDKVNNKAFKKQLKKVESGYYSLRQTFRYLLTQKIFPESLFCKFSLFCMEALMQEGELMEAMTIEREIKRFLQSHEEMLEERQYLFEDFEEGMVTGRTELAGILGRLFLKEGMRIQGENLAMQRQNTLLKSLGVPVPVEQEEASVVSKKKKNKKKKTSANESPLDSPMTLSPSVSSSKTTKVASSPIDKAVPKAKTADIKAPLSKTTKTSETKPKVPEVKPVTPKVPDTKVTNAAKVAATKPKVPEVKPVTPKVPDTKVTSAAKIAAAAASTVPPVAAGTPIKAKPATPSPPAKKSAPVAAPAPAKPSVSTPKPPAAAAPSDEWQTMPIRSTSASASPAPVVASKPKKAKPESAATAFPPLASQTESTISTTTTSSPDLGGWGVAENSWASKLGEAATVAAAAAAATTKPSSSNTNANKGDEPADDDGWGSGPATPTVAQQWGQEATTTTTTTTTTTKAKAKPTKQQSEQKKPTAPPPPGLGAAKPKNEIKADTRPVTDADGWATVASSGKPTKVAADSATPKKPQGMGGNGWDEAPAQKQEANNGWDAPSAASADQAAEPTGWGQEPATETNDGWGTQATEPTDNQGDGWGTHAAGSSDDALGGWGNIASTDVDLNKKEAAKSWDAPASTWEQESSKVKEQWRTPGHQQAPAGRSDESDNWRQQQQQQQQQRPTDRRSGNKGDGWRSSSSSGWNDQNSSGNERPRRENRGWNKNNDRWSEQPKRTSGWNPSGATTTTSVAAATTAPVAAVASPREDTSNGWGSASSSTVMPTVSTSEKSNVDVVNVSMKDILQQSAAAGPTTPTQPPGLIKDSMVNATGAAALPPLATVTSSPMTAAPPMTTTPPSLAHKEILSAEQLRSMSSEHVINIVQNLQQENVRLLQQLISAQQEMALQTTRYSEMMTISREREAQMMQLFEARKQTELEEGRRYILSLEARIGTLEGQLKAATAAGGGGAMGGITAGFGNQDLFAGYREEMRSNHQHRGRRHHYYNKPAVVRCGNCGGSGHTSAECQDACRYCGSTDHLSEACHANQ